MEICRYGLWIAVLGFLISVALPMAASAQPNSVQVQFHIHDPTYRSELGPGTPQAEDVLLKLAVGVLHNRIGFLRFTTQDKPNKIVIELGNSDRHAGDSIRFHLCTNSADARDLSWIFRSGADVVSALSKRSTPMEKIQDVDLVGASDNQPGEFRRKFASVGLDRLVEALRSMLIASKGDMPEGPPDPLWELPINRAETCMDLRSEFVIVHRLIRASGQSENLRLYVEAIGPDGSNSDAMTSHIQARIPASPDQSVPIRRMGGPNVQKVEVEGVYIFDYHPGDCSAVTLPTDSGLGKGGSQ